MPVSARAVGAVAERQVWWRYWLRGWRLCARNWVGGGGELDLVASRWTTLLVIEVRRRPTLDAAALSVDQAKLARTLAAARSLIATHGLHAYRLRIDLAAVDAAGRMRFHKDVTVQQP